METRRHGVFATFPWPRSHFVLESRLDMLIEQGLILESVWYIRKTCVACPLKVFQCGTKPLPLVLIAHADRDPMLLPLAGVNIVGRHHRIVISHGSLDLAVEPVLKQRCSQQ